MLYEMVQGFGNRITMNREYMALTMSCAPQKTRCKDKCRNEKGLKCSYKYYNSKCIICGISLNSDDKRCYCCGQPLRHKRAIATRRYAKKVLI